MLPADYYKDQLSKVAAQAITIKKKADLVAWSRAFTILLATALVYVAIRNGSSVLWLAVLLLAGILVYILSVQFQLKELARRTALHEQLLQDETKALEGDNSSFYAGDKYIDSAHEFSYDLDIFGPRSIYQALNRTVTNKGADTLANLLQTPYATHLDITDRQQITGELAGKIDFMHRFRITGMLAAEEQGAGQRLQRWLDIDDIFLNNKLIAVLLYSVPALSLLFITLSILQGRLHTGLILMIAINWAINIRYAKKIKETHYLVGESVKMIDQTEHLLAQIAKQEFSSPPLRKYKSDAGEAISAITGLKKLVHLFDNRQNGMVGPLLNSMFMFDVYCLTRLEKWRDRYKGNLTGSIQLVADIDCYCSLGNYAFNHRANTYPVINTSSTVIRTSELTHPLMLRNAAVGNNCTIGSEEQLYLLTGANMTGKSTFIRTIGTNLILAYIGVPVPASSFIFPLVKIFTSIRISDSVQDDVSYFKAELQRMQRLMQEAGNSDTPCLVLLDEPLRGTNSTDKQAGTKAIIEKLLLYKTIGIIATHDTNLCSLAARYPGKISNYHFESNISEGTLQFDYSLKPGCSTSHNATLLMQIMGIID